MKRTLVILISIFVLATALAAEERVMHSRVDAAAYLQLTSAQQSTWDSARRDFETAAEPLFTRQREIGTQIETALKSKSSDACGIGSLMIEQQGVLDQIRTAHQTLNQKQQAVLTPEQKAKYDALAATHSGEMHERHQY